MKVYSLIKSTLYSSLLTLSILSLSNPLVGQEKQTEHVYRIDSGYIAPQVDIQDFAGIVGSWSGTGLGGVCDELWMPPRDNIMHGIFRLIMDGKLVFSEYLSLGDSGEGYSLKVKHFTPEFIGWETKEDFVNFRFIKIEENTIYFSGLTIEHSDDKLNIYVAFRQKDGSTKEELFAFTKN